MTLRVIEGLDTWLPRRDGNITIRQNPAHYAVHKPAERRVCGSVIPSADDESCPVRYSYKLRPTSMAFLYMISLDEVRNGRKYLTGRALRFLSYEVRGLNMAVYILAGSAFLSSLLALLRDRLLAHEFGAGATLDIYYAAFRIPDLIFVGTGALVSVYVLIPELARRSNEAQRDYIDTVLVGFSALAVVVSGSAALAAPALLGTLFPQLSGGDHGALVMLTRIMLLQPVFLGLSNILAAITQIKHRYTLYSISPLLYNLGIILGVLILHPLWGIAGLAIGVVVGASMHFAIQLPSILADGFFHRVPLLREPRALFRTVAISIPRALALSMSQVTFIGLTALAATLASGSIAIFMFAFNLQAVPLAIIGASYSVAAFPTLAAAMSRGDRTLFIEHIATAARHVMFWSLPATALIIVLRAYIVRVILGSGAFDWTDTRLTAAAFALLSLSLAAQGLSLLLVRGYYAAGRTFIPFLVSLATTLGTIALGASLLGIFQSHIVADPMQALLRVVDVPGASVLVLAFVYTAVSIIGTIALMGHFEHRFAGFFSHVRTSWVHSVIAALGAGISAYAVLGAVGPIMFASTTLSVFTRGFAAGISGIIVAALVYSALGNREYKEIVESIRGYLAGLWIQTPEVVVVSAEEGSPTTTQ